MPIEVVPAPAQIRVLSSTEYRNTIRDLLGLTASSTLTHADWTGGYDNGAATQVDENLLSALLLEGEALAARYVSTRLAADFPCAAVAPAALNESCVRTIISTLGRRAWRRPLSSDQVDDLFALFRDAGIEAVVTRLISSPYFLYRTEVGQPVATGSDRFELSQFEKASLVSYTLTGTLPDELLLADAEAGVLDEEHLRAHVQRLWRAPQTRSRQSDFYRQWLKVTALDRMAQRPADFPKLTSPEQGASLKAEFDSYVNAVVFDGAGTLPSLFSEPFSFVDARVAPLYGLTSTSTSPERVTLPADQKRAGILTLASTMAAIGSATDAEKDRPVMRGLMIKRQLLCEDVGLPSNVNTVAAANAAMTVPNFDQLTTREQYEAMMQQGDSCRACHRQFMPLGFAFGNYDALGRFRISQHGRAVVTAVSDVPVAGQSASFTGAQDLSGSLATNPNTALCFGRNFARFTLGLPSAPHTETLSDSVVQSMGKSPLSISKLVEDTLANPKLHVRIATILPPDPDPVVDAGIPDAGTVTAPRVLLLGSSEELAIGASKSVAGFNLVNQLDGNLVLYRVGGGPTWASGTSSSAPGISSMQGDGNLVVYDRNGTPLFNTGTHGNAGATLHVDSDGFLFILATDGRVLWTSKGTP
ncbi:MAG: DUF1592 domain-containing protein [Archangium sp.]